jgi:hypothetical protein
MAGEVVLIDLWVADPWELLLVELHGHPEASCQKGLFLVAAD